MKKMLALGLACSLLAACSGGGDDGNRPPDVSGNDDFASAAALAVPGTAVSSLASDGRA